MIHHSSPEDLEEARRNFDESVYVAALREYEMHGRGGGIDDILAEIKRKLDDRT